ncbi:hypothetical protein CBA19CS91_26330 [Paraburkholderia hospita]|nr:hypothetical protein CBA19CS91_26330 [Paraburkholderia hospita]
MDTSLQKWNPFRFLRQARTGGHDRAKSPDTTAPPSEQAEIGRIQHVDPWQAMQELLNDPYAGFGSLDRRFGDFRPTRFRARIDVVD